MLPPVQSSYPADDLACPLCGRAADTWEELLGHISVDHIKEQIVTARSLDSCPCCGEHFESREICIWPEGVVWHLQMLHRQGKLLEHIIEAMTMKLAEDE